MSGQKITEVEITSATAAAITEVEISAAVVLEKQYQTTYQAALLAARQGPKDQLGSAIRKALEANRAQPRSNRHHLLMTLAHFREQAKVFATDLLLSKVAQAEHAKEQNLKHEDAPINILKDLVHDLERDGGNLEMAQAVCDLPATTWAQLTEALK